MAIPPSKVPNNEVSETEPARRHSFWKLSKIALAFVTVFFPLFFIATLLCLFVTIPVWTIKNPPEENANLPYQARDASLLTTKVLMNRVSVTSSFASNVGQFAAAPFLLLFSFLVALELTNRREIMDQDVTKLLQGDQTFFLNWTVLRLWRARNTKIAKATRIAGIGASISVVLTILLVAGDKVLQATLDETVQRVYDENSAEPDFLYPDYSGGFKINEALCAPTETVIDIYDETAPPPCSINGSTDPWTLPNARSAYQVLATGLLNQTGHYHEVDFVALETAYDAGAFRNTQLITHIHNVSGEQHILYFNPWSAAEDEDIKNISKVPQFVSQDLERIGLDYIATTTSIVTKCAPITTNCGIYNTTGPSIPYRCSDSFYGDLNEIPTNGLERLKGWNTTFFDSRDDSSRHVSIASQLNPFSYEITAVVDSIDLDGLIDLEDPQVPQGVVVKVGDGRVGFALSCNSTVYDVVYSLVDGDILAFNTTLAAPSTAAIFKAPVQAGFGSYELFEKAAMSVLLTQSTVMDAMELAFSQTFLALAAGVYAPTPSIEQRWRWDMTVTEIGKAPFYILVVCMFLYATVVVVFTVIALVLFWRTDVREVQAQLVP